MGSSPRSQLRCCITLLVLLLHPLPDLLLPLTSLLPPTHSLYYSSYKLLLIMSHSTPWSSHCSFLTSQLWACHPAVKLFSKQHCSVPFLPSSDASHGIAQTPNPLSLTQKAQAEVELPAWHWRNTVTQCHGFHRVPCQAMRILSSSETGRTSLGPCQYLPIRYRHHV